VKSAKQHASPGRGRRNPSPKGRTKKLGLVAGKLIVTSTRGTRSPENGLGAPDRGLPGGFSEASKRLGVLLPFQVKGITAKRGKPFDFQVRVTSTNISICKVVVTASPEHFSNAEQEIVVKIDAGGAQTVPVTLHPIKKSHEPLWVGIYASGDDIAQGAGMFVKVV
jgi:hypothetical protein